MSLTPRYTVAADHVRLGAKGRGLSPDALQAEVVLAETLLGLHSAGPDVGTDEGDEVTLAIVLQINFQLAQGVDPQIVESITTREGKSETFRDRFIDPKALSIATRVLAAIEAANATTPSTQWPTIRSYRTDN